MKNLVVKYYFTDSEDGKEKETDRVMAKMISLDTQYFTENGNDVIWALIENLKTSIKRDLKINDKD